MAEDLTDKAISDFLSKLRSGGLITIKDSERLLIETNPDFKTAVEGAEELARTFQFNEVINLLDQLIAEIDSMHIASRFSSEKKIFSSQRESVQTMCLNPMIIDMTERDYKKWQLKYDLTGLKSIVVNLSGQFRDIVIDLEGTKID